MKNIKLVTTVSFLVLLGCAKERPIDVNIDGRRDLNQKELLTGTKANPKLKFSRSTVVKVSENGGFAFVGLEGPAKMGYFKFSKEKLTFVSAASLYAKESVNTKKAVIDQWSITHHDIKLDDSSGKVTNKEVSDTDKEWYQRRNFKVDFSKHTMTGMVEGDGCFSSKTSSVVDDSIVLEKDYFTFVEEVHFEVTARCGYTMSRAQNSDMTYTVSYRHSFKTLEDSNYQPIIYKEGNSDPLRSKYGYFTTVQEKLSDKDGRPEVVMYMNRWDPNKVHNYFFSKDFPEEYKWMYNDPKIGVFAKTNEILEKTGKKIRFRIHDNNGVNGKVKEIGDIRYSFINLIEELNPDAPLGYGPSSTDPRTGEILNANVNIWTGYLKYYMKRIKGSMDRQDSVKESSLFVRMKEFLGTDSDEWAVPMSVEKNGAGRVFQDLMHDNLYAFPYWNGFTKIDREEAKQKYFTRRDDKLIGELIGEDKQHLFNLQNDEMDKIIDKNFSEIAEHKHDQSGNCRYPVIHHAADIKEGLIDGVEPKQILDAILYRVAIHEFGHNLNLRHNFLGSVDKKNFHPDRVIKDGEGNDKVVKAMSSSVMDYLSLEDEMYSDMGWETYDEAAIFYAYSGGKELDPSKSFLFCTDEDKILNAMCNTWDHGSTPTEVVKSIIDDYEKLYHVVNYRYDRAYWNTTGYASRIYNTMFKVKKFLVMWRTDFTEDKIMDSLSSRTDIDQYEKEELAIEINQQFLKTVKLSLAFYNGVIQQSSADRPWRTEYDRQGAVTRIGILNDKVFATRFLVGDEGFMYNPSKHMNYASYLTYSTGVADSAMITPFVKKALENTVTVRVDMDIWFLSYAKSLYAMNAFNNNNITDRSLIERIKVMRMSGKRFFDNFGIKPNELPVVSKDFIIKDSLHPDIHNGTVVGIVKYDGSIYVVDKSKSPYAYNLVEKIRGSLGSSNINRSKNDLAELYDLYQRVTR